MRLLIVSIKIFWQQHKRAFPYNWLIWQPWDEVSVDPGQVHQVRMKNKGKSGLSLLQLPTSHKQHQREPLEKYSNWHRLNLSTKTTQSGSQGYQKVSQITLETHSECLLFISVTVTAIYSLAFASARCSVVVFIFLMKSSMSEMFTFASPSLIWDYKSKRDCQSS